MNIIIGFVLLVYGVAGVIGAFLVYRWLFAKKGPFEQLRVLIKKAADKIQEASGYAVYASKTTGEASSALQVVSDQIGKTLPPLNASVEAVKLMRDRVGTIEELANNFQVQVPMPTSTPVSFLLTYPKVQDITMTRVGKIGKIVIYGMPLNIEWGTETTNVGPVDFPTIVPTPVNPLTDIGAQLHEIWDKLDQLYYKIDEVHTYMENIQTKADQTKEEVDTFNEDVLVPLPKQLSDTSEKVLALRHNRYLRLTPTGIIIYFGLIHLAFALTGIGLIFG